MSFLKYSCQTQKWFFKKNLWYRNDYFTSYRWKVFGLKSIKTENVNFKIFSIFVFHIRMRTICWIINPINFIKLCALSREKVAIDFFRFFFPEKKEKKKKNWSKFRFLSYVSTKFSTIILSVDVYLFILLRTKNIYVCKKLILEYLFWRSFNFFHKKNMWSLFRENLLHIILPPPIIRLISILPCRKTNSKQWLRSII